MLETKRLESILRLLIGLVLIILINVLATRGFYRIDLTEEGRFSIAEATKDMLADLPDDVFVEVYLDGDLPTSFERMKKSIAETLDEFRIYSKGKVHYQFINPDESANEQVRNQLIQRMYELNVPPTDVTQMDDGQRIQKRIIPGAKVIFGAREKGALLLKGNQAAPTEIRINQSIEGLEYELASTILELTKYDRKTIGFLKGHNELDSLDIISFRRSLSEKYTVVDVILDTTKHISGIDLLMINQPTTLFTEPQKFLVDQFIMNGGKAIFLLDLLTVNMDSANVGTFSFPYNHNLQDLLFKYGVRINNDLVQDLVSNTHPIVVGNTGSQPQIQRLPWPFYPIVNNYSNHTITRNLDAVLTRFANSIDSVRADGIKKTALMFTSQYSRSFAAPVSVNIEDMKEAPQPEKFTEINLALGYLLEGRFSSLYKNRFPPEGMDQLGFVQDGVENKIVVFSDGDLVRNEFDPRSGRPLPVGDDPYSPTAFANLDLMLNTIDFMLEGEGLITARAKEIKIRPLDQVKIDNERTKWQLINVVAPVLLVILYGVAVAVLRKRKYSRFESKK